MKLSWIVFVSIALIMTSCQPKTKEKLKAIEVLPDSSVIKRVFKPNGTLFAEILFKYGKRNGVAKNFYEDGTIEIETNYIDNKKEGDTRSYYPGGKVCRHLIFKNDLRNGIESHYYKDGKIACEIPYLNGEVEPGLKEYNEKGKLIDRNPTIVVTPIDIIATANKYVLNLALSDKSKAVAFARVYFENGKKTIDGIKTQNGIGNLYIYVDPRKGYKGKVILEASYETMYGNPYVTRTTYNLLIGKIR